MRPAPSTAFLGQLGLLLLAACPAPVPAPLPDAEVEDAGVADPDAGPPDAGEPEDAGVPDAGFGPVQAGAWCATRALAVCGRDLRCGRLDPAQLADCEARSLATCDQPAYSRAVADGRLQYFADAGGLCLDAYNLWACTELTGAPAECDGLFQGLVPADGGCILPEECQAGSFCQVYLNSCPYRCFAYVAVGETCNWWDRQCDPAAASCEFTDAGAYGCLARAGVGLPCVYSTDCRADLACGNGFCVKARSAVGEGCNEAGGYPMCGPEAFCRTLPSTDGGMAGTCQKRVGLGGACSGYGACLPNLRCTSALATGTCQPLGAEGATCTGYGECRNELFCWPHTSTCTAYFADGGDCTAQGSQYTCASGWYCDFSAQNGAYVCTRKKALGEECTYDEVCQSGACEYGTLTDAGFGYACTEPCSTRADCGF